MSGAHLSVAGLGVSYGPVRVLHELDLNIPAGAVAALFGANGAGKTTLLRAISGLVPATGDIRLDGVSLRNLPAEERAKSGVGHVPEGRGTFRSLSVAENLRAGALARRGRGEASASIEAAYERFPVLRERSRQIAGTLSGGEEQMLAIARVLMGQPRLLLLDEPASGLAERVAEAVMAMIAALVLREGLTVLVVDPNPSSVRGIATAFYALERGQIRTADGNNLPDLSSAQPT